MCVSFRCAAGDAALVGIFALASLPVAAAGSYYIDTSLEYRHDDNIGRAENDTDIIEDNIVAFSIAANLPELLNERSGALYVARLAYDRHTDQDDLSRFTASAAATWRYRPGAGFASPWYEINVTGALLEHQDSALRDGALARASLSAGKNFTDRILARATYRYELRRAWDGDVFDTDNHRISGSFDYRPAERVTFYGTLAWQTGEIVSTATPSSKVINASEARAVDDALSEQTAGAPGPGGYSPGERIAYRLDADLFSSELGLNVALSRKLAADFSALHFRAHGKDDNDYDGLILRASLLYRF